MGNLFERVRPLRAILSKPSATFQGFFLTSLCGDALGTGGKDLGFRVCEDFGC